MSYFFPAGASALYSISHALANPHIRDISGDMYAMAAALGIPTLYHAARRYPGGVPYLVTKNLHGTPEAINPLAPSMMMGKLSFLSSLEDLLKRGS